ATARTQSFAFEQLRGFDADAVAGLRCLDRRGAPQVRLTGQDRDQGVIAMAQDNADRAGVADITDFAVGRAEDCTPPDSPPGIVMINPPYGARIGNKKALYPVYGRLGQVLAERFAGWRVGIVTSEAALAKTTGLPFLPDGPSIAHGGLRVKLWRTGPLG
ncbi:MAG: class I SAM-dependent RNA methyltransferase, partial [Pseudomonadota bacterium]